MQVFKRIWYHSTLPRFFVCLPCERARLYKGICYDLFGLLCIWAASLLDGDYDCILRAGCW